MSSKSLTVQVVVRVAADGAPPEESAETIRRHAFSPIGAGLSEKQIALETARALRKIADDIENDFRLGK